MNIVTVSEVDRFMSNATIFRPITRQLGTTELALNYFEVESGDAFSIGCHTHLDQEEVIYVLSGTATWKTEEGTQTVSEGQVIRFRPGEFHHGYNNGTEKVVAIGIGAPKDSEDIVVECDGCGERVEPSMNMADGREAIEIDCPECDSRIARMT
jgi:quercetin dioxygenase-like cupin family protein